MQWNILWIKQKVVPSLASDTQADPLLLFEGKRLKILIVHPHIYPGGAEKAVVKLARNLVQLGNEVYVGTLSLDLRGMSEDAYGLNYITPDREILPIPPHNTISTLRRYFSELVLLRRLVRKAMRERRYDVINAHNFPAYWAVSSVHGAPLVWTCNEVLGTYRETRELSRRSQLFRNMFSIAKFFDELLVNRFISAIIANSFLTRSQVKERYGRDAYVAIPGVDAPSYTSIDRKDLLAFSSYDGLKILDVGSLTLPKNHHLVIGAAAALHNEGERVRLLIVGDGPLRDELNSRILKGSLRDSAQILARCSEEELNFLYRSSDVVVLPAIDQTFGLVPVEALASGTPTIVSKGSGVTKLIEGSRACLAVEPQLEPLVNALRFLIKNKESIKSEARTEAARIRSEFPWSNFAKKHLQVFEAASREGYH